jgi:hypothetical protein
VKFYLDIQVQIPTLRSERARYLERVAKLTRGRQRLKALDGPLVLALLAPLFSDVRLETHERVADPDSRANVELVLASESFCGELGLALYEELLEAKQIIACHVCGRDFAAADNRRRLLCEREECRAEYRRRVRRPEPRGASTSRVHRFRAGNKSRSS